jgi:hypothetical protein
MAEWKGLVMIASRPDKPSHGQTILFEIDMLRFAAGKLLKVGDVPEHEQWVWLEDFLLHYRDLIEFLGHPRPETPICTSRVRTFWTGFLRPTRGSSKS